MLMAIHLVLNIAEILELTRFTLAEFFSDIEDYSI